MTIRTRADVEAWANREGIVVDIFTVDKRTTLPKDALLVACRAIERLVNAERKPKPRAAKRRAK